MNFVATLSKNPDIDWHHNEDKAEYAVYLMAE